MHHIQFAFAYQTMRMREFLGSNFLGNQDGDEYWETNLVPRCLFRWLHKPLAGAGHIHNNFVDI
jgi:hypothetical protein